VYSRLGSDCGLPSVNSPCFRLDANCGLTWDIRDGETVSADPSFFVKAFVVREGQGFDVKGRMEQFGNTAACNYINGFPWFPLMNFQWMQSGTQDVFFSHMNSGADVEMRYRVEVVVD